MGSPDWEDLYEKFIEPEVERSTKDYQIYFKKGVGENQLHNLIFNMQYNYRQRKGYKTKNPQKDIHKLSIVKNSNKMLPYVQAKLIQDKKVIKYQYKEKEIIRNNVKWTDEEIKTVFTLKEQGMPIKSIAKRLGRSYASIYNKLKKVIK